MKRFLYLICILIAASGCKEVFEAPPQSFLKVSFLNSSTKATISPKVSVLGVGLENMWVKDSVLKEILLPLSVNDATSYLISLDAKNDTITFIHETIQKYASMESGFYFEYKLQSIDFTNNRIDSILITDSLVTKKWNENIKLYVHPLPSGNN
ncbi:MAG TPA: hypothetical protein DCR40_00065 [Prolixibacteraceae bacterium]|nr:hypothetical protein [Prolixibacteraceae bacterium]